MFAQLPMDVYLAGERCRGEIHNEDIRGIIQHDEWYHRPRLTMGLRMRSGEFPTADCTAGPSAKCDRA